MAGLTLPSNVSAPGGGSGFSLPVMPNATGSAPPPPPPLIGGGGASVPGSFNPAAAGGMNAGAPSGTGANSTPPPSPPSMVTPPPKKNNTYLIIALVAVILIAVGSGIFYFITNSLTPKPPPATPTPVSTPIPTPTPQPEATTSAYKMFTADEFTLQASVEVETPTQTGTQETIALNMIVSKQGTKYFLQYPDIGSMMLLDADENQFLLISLNDLGEQLITDQSADFNYAQLPPYHHSNFKSLKSMAIESWAGQTYDAEHFAQVSAYFQAGEPIYLRQDIGTIDYPTGTLMKIVSYTPGVNSELFNFALSGLIAPPQVQEQLLVEETVTAPTTAVPTPITML